MARLAKLTLILLGAFSVVRAHEHHHNGDSAEKMMLSYTHKPEPSHDYQPGNMHHMAKATHAPKTPAHDYQYLMPMPNYEMPSITHEPAYEMPMHKSEESAHSYEMPMITYEPKYDQNMSEYKHKMPEHEHTMSEDAHKIPKYEHDMPEHKKKMPKCEHEMPEYEHKVPEYEHKMPEYEHKKPEYEHKMPEYEHKMPEYEHKMPEHEHKMPEYEHKMPEYEHKMPEYEHKVPEYERKKPEYEHKMPEYEHKVPEYEHKVPEYEHKVPEYEHKMPEHEQKKPKHYSSLNDKCRFKFCDYATTFKVNKHGDRAFTGRICSKKGVYVGTVDETGEAYLLQKHKAIRISKWSPYGLKQHFSPSFFKAYAVKHGKFSGVGHEVAQQNQAHFLHKRCWSLPVRAYQVLDKKSGNVITEKHTRGHPMRDCVSFCTKLH